MKAPKSQLIYSSGQLEVDLAQRELRVCGSPVSVGGRAFEIIEVLIQAAGALVSKDDLMERVWPGAVVEENTLEVHISAVRKALGPDRGMLKTQKGKGYRLLGTWDISQGTTSIRGSAGLAIGANNLPAPGTDMIGRAEARQQIGDLLSAYRLITLTGPGGIGKTKLAVETARHLLAQDHGEVWLVELASLSDPDLVPSAVASALGLRLGVHDLSRDAVARALARRQLLLLLDNCEHVIDAVAMFVEIMLRLSPGTIILATSREVMRIDGEYVYRVPPLDVPGREESLVDIAKRSAVQLFVTRTMAMNAAFVPDEVTLPQVADICQHLDGIPLAIEFAAARAGMVGVSQVAAQLNDRFGLLTAGRRTTLARHQTLRAALDWSYDLLTTAEQRLFHHLSIFPAGFTVAAAAAVAGNADQAATVIDSIENLVAKSLVTLDGSVLGGRWRLLETIRAYALEKLEASGERQRVSHSHAKYYCALFERVEREVTSRPPGEWLADYAREFDSVRAALDWAFSSTGDALLGVALTALSVPMWTDLSLIEECRSCVERALSALDGGVKPGAAVVMKLQAALALSVMYTRGMGAETGATWAKALELAEELNNAEYQLRSLWGLWLFHRARGQHEAALERAQRFCAVAVAQPEPNDRFVGERMVGESLHLIGTQGSALSYLERVIDHYDDFADRDSRSSASRFLYDSEMSARIYQARILWLQGYPDRAMRIVATSVEDARAARHTISLCYALAHAACPIALWAGNEAEAEKYIGMLTDEATRRALPNWHGLGRCYEGVLALSRGDPSGSVRLLHEGLCALEEATPGLHYGMVLASLALGLGHAGQIDEGLVKIDEVIARAQRTDENWLTAEVLRIKGDLLLLRGVDAEVVQDLFLRAIEWARMQGARSWELRAATSLARLMSQLGRPADAITCLGPVYDFFEEGFATTDLTTAKELLDELRLSQ